MYGVISLTCDNSYELYANDEILGSSNHWKKTKKHKFTFRNGENVILIKCKNQTGAAGLVVNIKYTDNENQNLIVTDESWEASIDNINWFPAKIVCDYGTGPWKKPLPLDDSTKWIWYHTIEDNQTVWIKKTIVYQPTKTKENIKEVKKETAEIVTKEISFQESWDKVIEEATEKLRKINEEEILLKKFERFITPNHSDIIKKVNELNNDPKKCYRFVSDQIKYVSDDTNYGKSEFWTYPHETLKKGSGDCEDQAFLIASMFSYLNIECFIRTAYLLDYQGGHAWCYFKWEGQWLAAECTSSSFDPWNKDKRPKYGSYLPWIDIQIGKSHNYTGLELIKHALRIQAKDYDDGTVEVIL